MNTVKIALAAAFVFVTALSASAMTLNHAKSAPAKQAYTTAEKAWFDRASASVNY